MGKSSLVVSGIDNERLQEACAESDKLSETISALVRNIVSPATKELDSVMERIYKRLLNKDMGEIMLPELEDFLAELCSVMYRTQMKVEQIGILSDMSKNVYDDVYSNAVKNSCGSAKDTREAEGRTKAKYEALCWDIRKRAYSIAKLKMDGAERQSTALRKIITARLDEYGGGRNDGTDN